MNRRKNKIVIGLCACILGISLPAIAMAETSSRRANIKSTGNIDFGNGEVYIASSDLVYLADEIDNLEDTYKTETVNALNDIGTFFLNDGTAVRNINQNEADLDDEKAALSFGKIMEGIRSSQSIESLSQMQATDDEGNLLYYKTEEAQNNKDLFSLTTDDTGFPTYYQPANANNLSAGTAAWVNGTLIKGNGSDNAAYYDSGKQNCIVQIPEIFLKENFYIYTSNDTQENFGGKSSSESTFQFNCKNFTTLQIESISGSATIKLIKETGEETRLALTATSIDLSPYEKFTISVSTNINVSSGYRSSYSASNLNP